MEVKILQLENEEKAPVKIANKCFDHKIEYDNNSEIERERVSDERRKNMSIIHGVCACAEILLLIVT